MPQVDSALVAFKLFDERSYEATKLIGIALGKMQSEFDNQLMWVALSVDDLTTAHASEESSEGVVNLLRNVRGAKLAIVIRERMDELGPVARVSVRALPDLRADLFCAQFGGGGHAAAAGCRLRNDTFDQSVRAIVTAARLWIPI